MANSAFGHEPSFTTPGLTTDNAVIRWDGTSGDGQLNSGIIIDDSNVITGVTSLTVDNLLINGNTISSTAGTDLLITPLGGQQIVLDGTIIIDAGVVTGATSITSTEFVGGGVGLTALNGTQVTSGTLPAARIGNDSIVEGKLNVSNGPTNGYVLTARDGVAGGFTWEAAAGGASAAGNSGSIQFSDGSSGLLADNGQLHWDATNNRLGIGTASPAKSLHLYQGSSGGSARATTMLVLEDDTTDEICIQFLMPGTSGTPQQSIFFGDAADGTVGRIIYDHIDNQMRIGTGGSDRMIVTSAGKIGLDGVTAPNGNLTIGTANAIGSITAPAIQVGVGNSNTFRLGLYSSEEGGHLHNNNGNDGILLESRDVEVARFWASGTNRHVGFGGITTPADTMFKISYSAQSWVTNFTNAHGSGSNHVNQWNFGGFSPDSHNNIYLYAADTTAARIFIYSDGDVTNHDNSYGSTSDERIKQDIRDTNSQWDDIKAIRVRNFKKKEDVAQYGDRAWEQIGVIAQEVELVSPKLIREGAPSKFEMEQLGMGHEVENGENETKWVPNVDEDGNEVTIKSIGYSVLYMKAFKALQEAMARIEILETEVDALKG